MTRAEYLSELESHLIALPKEERDMAVSFYEEYFDEAGPENVQSVIDELGKPFNLARSIIGETSAYSRSMVYLKYKESKPMPQNSTEVFASLRKPDAFAGGKAEKDSFENTMKKGVSEQQHINNAYEQDIYPDSCQNGSENNGMFDDYYKKGMDKDISSTPKVKSSKAGWVIFWIVIGFFIGIPVICAGITLIIAIVLMLFAFAIASFACIIGAVIMLISGIIHLFSSVGTGLGLVFAGFFAAGIGLMLLSGSIVIFFKFLPWCIREINKLRNKRRAA